MFACPFTVLLVARDGLTKVPGCSGEGRDDVDHCYDPNSEGGDDDDDDDDDRDDDDRDDDGREDDADDGDGEVKEVVLSEGRDYDALVDLGDQEGTLGKCAGHCNTRLDCNKGLRCFKSSGSFALVPGCLGVGSRRVQYCYDPAAASLPLNMIDRLTDAPTGMGKPTSKPTISSLWKGARNSMGKLRVLARSRPRRNDTTMENLEDLPTRHHNRTAKAAATSRVRTPPERPRRR